LFFFSTILFYYPNTLGHPDNYIPADPMSTPAHIVPEWYFLPFYAVLRSIPDKLAGVVAMGGAIVILLFLPFINTSDVRSSTFRPFYRKFFWFLFADFFIAWLDWARGSRTAVRFDWAAWYSFLFFLLFNPYSCCWDFGKFINSNENLIFFIFLKNKFF